MTPTGRDARSRSSRRLPRSARAVRAARERAGLGVRELAALAGLSAATLSDVESGTDPRASTLESLLAHLPSLTPAELLGGEEDCAAGRDAWWSFMRDALGLSVARLRLEVSMDAAGRRTHVALTGIRPSRGSLLDEDTLRRVLHLVFLGFAEARPQLARIRLRAGEEARVEEPWYRHSFRLAAQPERHGLSYEREQLRDDVPPGPAPGALGLSGPLPRGVSLAVELPVEELEIAARFEGDVPHGARCAAWAVQQPVAPDEPDLLDRVHRPGDVSTSRSPRRRALGARVTRPWAALHYGLGWGEDASHPARPAPLPGPRGEAIRRAREAAGQSQRELARRLTVSPVTIAGAERGLDVRASFLSSCLAELPGLAADSLLATVPAPRPVTRREAWELQRRAFGIEADEERKTLHVTASGDAHAVCETLRLRRCQPGGHDLRVRYSSALAASRRLPTALEAIEDALAEEAEETGLKARVVERREGRLIHEIIVPRRLATTGVSYSRRLFDQGFFAPGDESRATGEIRHDGAAIVPSHPVRRLHLRVVLPPGWFPSRVTFGVHPRLRLEGPLPEADLAASLHPEGLAASVSPKERAIELSVEHPLVGFLYDVFWERA